MKGHSTFLRCSLGHPFLDGGSTSYTSAADTVNIFYALPTESFNLIEKQSQIQKKKFPKWEKVGGGGQTAFL